MSQASKLLLAGVAGAAATLVLYFALMVIQIVNADPACETYPEEIPRNLRSEFREPKFENTVLNLGGRCTYYLTDGRALVTREPGWWFSATIAGFVTLLAGLAVLGVRRKGHPGLLYGLTTLVAPPLGLTLAATASRKTRIGLPP